MDSSFSFGSFCRLLLYPSFCRRRAGGPEPPFRGVVLESVSPSSPLHNKAAASSSFPQACALPSFLPSFHAIGGPTSLVGVREGLGASCGTCAPGTLMSICNALTSHRPPPPPNERLSFPSFPFFRRPKAKARAVRRPQVLPRSFCLCPFGALAFASCGVSANGSTHALKPSAAKCPPLQVA